MPATPSTTFPFSTATVEMARASRVQPTMAGAPSLVEKGRKPIRTSPPTSAATTTASTERRPSSAQ